MATRHPERYRKFLVRLREAREAAGLSQERVAELIGERQRFLSKVERGERRIDPVELKELADLYGKPLDFFVE
jgi:transcriptional regulator with XRE-family HTH domain